MNQSRYQWEKFFVSRPCQRGWYAFVAALKAHRGEKNQLAAALREMAPADRAWAAGHAHETRMLDILMRDRYMNTRCQVVTNPHTAPSTLARATRDRSFVVRHLVAKRHEDLTTRSVRASFDRETDSEICRMLAEDVRISADDVERKIGFFSEINLDSAEKADVDRMGDQLLHKRFAEESWAPFFERKPPSSIWELFATMRVIAQRDGGSFDAVFSRMGQALDLVSLRWIAKHGVQMIRQMATESLVQREHIDHAPSASPF